MIQNAEDNEYEEGVKPRIKFIVGKNYLLIQNNEKGFRREDVWALCGIGQSTKRKALGYIGEKGIGFKSVFMITNEPHIYSNGFQFKFEYDERNPVSIIIPKWVDEIPSFIDLQQTNIFLPFKPEVKRSRINRYIKELDPAILLFLRKIKLIEIEDEKRSQSRKIERYEKNGMVQIVYDGKESYWKVVKKSFRVPQWIREERRQGIDETEIILAFPLNKKGLPDVSNEQFVFAFLPVRKYGFRFIVQADFLLPVSREDIIKDNKWNEWLRDSIVKVFFDAVKEFKRDANLKYSFYSYIPVKEEINDEFFLPVVDQIYKKLQKEKCVLSEANRWRTPSEIVIGDEEIKKIVTNRDLQNIFGKEYLSGKVRSVSYTHLTLPTN